jgi:hypothetical protein
MTSTHLLIASSYPGMLALFALSLLAGAALFSVWYWYCIRRAKQRAIQVLGWIEGMLVGHGHVSGLEWCAPSRFQVPIRLRSNIFREPALTVQMCPREFPFRWLLARFRKEQETITFEADLDLPPSFNLDLQSYRLYARTRKDLEPEGRSWHYEQTTPFILTTRPDWRKEITDVIASLLSADRKFLNVTFRRTSPHFTAIMQLEAITPGNPDRSQMFDALCQLAAGSSASQV